MFLVVLALFGSLVYKFELVHALITIFKATSEKSFQRIACSGAPLVETNLTHAGTSWLFIFVTATLRILRRSMD